MAPQQVHEEDFPQGHPKRFDYDPKSDAAVEWARKHIHPKGERDFPVDHVKAVDSKNSQNSVEWRAGVDPFRPEIEAHTGATPEVAEARRKAEAALSAQARETPTLPEGFVDTAKVAEESAVAFLQKQGHDEDAARQIVREQGVDKILAAKDTLQAGE